MAVKICECKKDEPQEVPLIQGKLYRFSYQGVTHIGIGYYQGFLSLTTPSLNWVVSNSDFIKDMRKMIQSIERLPKGTCIEYTSDV